MDILKAPPPRPPSTSTTTSLIVSDITKTNELYDVLIHSGGPDVYFNIDTSFINETFLNSSLYNVSNSSTTPNITTQIDEEPVSELIIMAITSMILGLMILVTVIGNVFVIAAIILERNLQNVANYLVASLAVADLFVACLVMPLGAVYEISKGWILGPELCDIWTSCDVLCCTASILHLVAIALDRYWAVTNVDYMHSRTAKRVFTMIFIIWFVSIIVSLAPQFGWKDPEYLQRIEQQKCMVSQDIAYQVFATCCTFYVPLLVILVLYWKIYQTARRRIHRRTPKLPTHPDNSQEASSSANGSSKPKKPRLKFSLPSKFRNRNKNRSGAISSLGLMDGNSTNTVNTVEYTEDSTNVNDKIKVTTFTSGDEMPTSSGEPISTVSHQVASKVIVIEGDHHNSCNNNNNLNIESPSSPNSTNNNNFNKNNDQSNQLAIKSMSLTRNTSKQQPQQQLQADAITKSSSTQHLPTGSTPTGPSHSQLTTPIQQQKQQHNLTASTQVLNSTPNPYAQINKRKETLEAKRERKAAKTLAIITGAFVFCWLPFFIMALLLPLCATCSISETISSFFLWLGYFNSTLNPVIYTIFSPEFRQAFKRILFGQSHNKPSYYRRGKL